MRRRVLSAIDIDGLPEGCTKVNYIQSNGTPYIDTGVHFTDRTGIETLVMPMGNGALFGEQDFGDSSTKSAGMSRLSGYGNWCGFYMKYILSDGTSYGTSCFKKASYTSGAKYRMIARWNRVALYENDTKIVDDSGEGAYPSEKFTSPKTILMFAGYSASTVEFQKTASRFYSFKIFDGDSVAHDYIPVVKNNVGYMYDKIGRKLLGNVAGSGAFTWG